MVKFIIITLILFSKFIEFKTMDNLEPYPGFYDDNEYGEYEKHFLHHATVSMLNVYIYNS